MPTYSYSCTECGRSFDIHQSFSDDALTVCSECGGTLRKLFNSVGVVFKGSGFYRTDSRGSGSSSSTVSADKSASTPSTSSSESASTPKAAATAPVPAATGSKAASN